MSKTTEQRIDKLERFVKSSNLLLLARIGELKDEVKATSVPAPYILEGEDGIMYELKVTGIPAKPEPEPCPNIVEGDDGKLYKLGISGGSAEPVIGQKTKTCVTVWMPDDGFISPFTKLLHSGPGLPDIPAIIADTLNKGALAVKVECSEMLNFIVKGPWTGCYIWQKCLGKRINESGWEYKNYYAWHLPDIRITDTDIESAITDYLSKEKPARDVNVRRNAYPVPEPEPTLLKENDMPEKNWTKTKPTESGWYWYMFLPNTCAMFSYLSITNNKLHILYGVYKGFYHLEILAGWWAKATPPPFDGEDGE